MAVTFSNWTTFTGTDGEAGGTLSWTAGAANGDASVRVRIEALREALRERWDAVGLDFPEYFRDFRVLILPTDRLHTRLYERGTYDSQPLYRTSAVLPATDTRLWWWSDSANARWVLSQAAGTPGTIYWTAAAESGALAKFGTALGAGTVSAVRYEPGQRITRATRPYYTAKATAATLLHLPWTDATDGAALRQRDWIYENIAGGTEMVYEGPGFVLWHRPAQGAVWPAAWILSETAGTWEDERYWTCATLVGTYTGADAKNGVPRVTAAGSIVVTGPTTPATTEQFRQLLTRDVMDAIQGGIEELASRYYIDTRGEALWPTKDMSQFVPYWTVQGLLDAEGMQTWYDEPAGLVPLRQTIALPAAGGGTVTGAVIDLAAYWQTFARISVAVDTVPSFALNAGTISVYLESSPNGTTWTPFAGTRPAAVISKAITTGYPQWTGVVPPARYLRATAVCAGTPNLSARLLRLTAASQTKTVAFPASPGTVSTAGIDVATMANPLSGLDARLGERPIFAEISTPDIAPAGLPSGQSLDVCWDHSADGLTAWQEIESTRVTGYSTYNSAGGCQRNWAALGRNEQTLAVKRYVRIRAVSSAGAGNLSGYSAKVAWSTRYKVASADWVRKMHLFLDRLRVSFDEGVFGSSIEETKTGGPEASEAATLAAYNLASFGAATPGYSFGGLAMFDNAGGQSWTLERKRCAAKATIAVKTSRFIFDAWALIGGLDSFECNDYVGAAEDRPRLMLSYTTPAYSHAGTVIGTLGDFVTVPAAYPATPPGEINSRGYEGDLLFAVIKFDCAGGFKMVT